MRIAELSDKRVAVWGYGREGAAALAALHARLPTFPVTLFCSEAEALGLPQRASNVTVVSVQPDAATLSAFDIVIKSPGISIYRPEIVLAQHAGTLFTSGTALWFAERPEARVIAVTGTKGKSTVTALIAHLLRARGMRVALAGNIGLPLLDLLDPAQPPDWWVLELSSFQTREAHSVDVGVINNLYEEHLDWHGTRERYADDKLALAVCSNALVINATQSELVARTASHQRRSTFGEVSGWHVAADAVWRGPQRVFELAASPLPGPHNAMNLCAALAAIEAAGEDALAAAAGIGSFRPLPHRLQTLGERDGRTFVDDSIATTPQATLEALASFSERWVSVLVGGYERGLDWHAFAEQVRVTPPHAIVTMGASGSRIHATLRAAGGAYRLDAADSLADGFAIARAHSPVDGVVLLSPGAPSFDQFKNYAARGCAFAELAGFDPTAIGAIEGLGIA